MNPDDPKLTAYALGELDEPERSEMEELLRQDPAAAAEVAALREFTARLRSDLHGEKMPGLTEDQRAEVFLEAKRAAEGLDGNAVVAMPDAGEEETKPGGHRWRIWIPTALAACLALGFISFFMRTRSADTESKGKPTTALATRNPASFAAPAAQSNHWNAPVDKELNDTREKFTLAASDPVASKPGLGAMPMRRLADANSRSASSAEPAVEGKQVVDAKSLMEQQVAPAAPVPPPAEPATGIESPTLLASRLSPEADPMAGRKPAAETSLNEQIEDVSLAKPAKPVALAQAMQKNAAAPSDDASSNIPKPALKLALNQPQKSDALTVYKAEGEIETLQARASKTPLAGGIEPKDSPEAMDKLAYNADGADRARQQAGVTGRFEAPAAAAAPAPLPTMPGSAAGTAGTADNSTLDLDSAAAKSRAKGVDGFQEEGEFRKAQESQPLYNTYFANGGMADGVPNPFVPVRAQPVATVPLEQTPRSNFSFQATLVRSQRPQPQAVHLEKMINEFSYHYPAPKGAEPISVAMEIASCPWMPEHRLLRVGLKAREMTSSNRSPANVVFLVDLPAGQGQPDALPAVKSSLGRVVKELGPEDKVAIVENAGKAKTVLEPTNDKAKVMLALNKLEKNPPENNRGDIESAYTMARGYFSEDGRKNLIVTADANDGSAKDEETQTAQFGKRTAGLERGVSLKVVETGGSSGQSGSDSAVVRSESFAALTTSTVITPEALAEKMNQTLTPVADDVKVHLRFNPETVDSYRLLGYENPATAPQISAEPSRGGQMGSGQSVTVLYELKPAISNAATLGLMAGNSTEKKAETRERDLRRSVSAPSTATAGAAAVPEAMGRMQGRAKQTTVKPSLTLELDWKSPETNEGFTRQFPLVDSGKTWQESTEDFRWSASVASFGLLLKDSPYKGSTTWDSALKLGTAAKGKDADGARKAFLNAMEKLQVK